MNEALLVSNLVLWAVVVALACVVAALVRQVGVLYERVAPAGALVLPQSLEVGSAAPVIEVEALDGTPRRIGAPQANGRSMLVFFVSPTCPVCKQLLGAVRAMARAERAWLDVVVASDGPRPEHEAYVARERLHDLPYVLSAPLGVAYRVGKLPYAVLIDGAGIVRGAGLVNSREHLESLIEAKERGVASIQDYLQGARA
ncbi:MAG TPA: methylamine dehydrogenase accessory protein MauD [Candidatus Limnocylindria bacterium]|nr:methylamine dehydrogenase accessory protein MauD [Candidatus Limnocylindria bacterium]